MAATNTELSPDVLVGAVQHDVSQDPFPVAGWDALVWVAGNATQSAMWFQMAFGMTLEAYAGPATGSRDFHSYVLRSGDARFVIKGAVSPESPLADHHRRHGDGVIDVALAVLDVDKCVEHARAAGARIVVPAHDESDADGTVRLAVIAAYGDTVHTIVDRSRYRGVYLPGYVRRESTASAVAGAPVFVALDHVVGNVELGAMDEWVDFYRRVMGFTNLAEFIGDDIATKYSALMSKVVASGDHRVKFPLNDPPSGSASRKSTSTWSSTRDPGSSTLLWRPPTSSRPWTRCGSAAWSSSRRRIPTTPTRRCAPGSGPCGFRSRNCSRAASWWTATRTVTCCRSSPSRLVTGRPCSSS